MKLSLAEFPDWKNYVAALDTIFTKLAALGEVIPDQVKRFHLLEGLGDEYHSIVSTVFAYETPGGAHADYAKAVERISAYGDNFAARRFEKMEPLDLIRNNFTKSS